jgi:FkbM family methyltransferase
MKTANKIAVARALHRLVRSGRAVAGRSGKGIFTRRGIVYELDLSEGIDLAIYLGGMFERRTALALGRLVEPSALVLDIGANIGAHTLPLADLVGPQGRVMAFEPTDFAFRKLKRNLDLNPSLAGRVESLHCFLSGNDQASVPAAVYSSWPLGAEQGLHAKHLGREMQTEQARARSLDRVLSEHAGPPGATGQARCRWLRMRGASRRHFDGSGDAPDFHDGAVAHVRGNPDLEIPRRLAAA